MKFIIHDWDDADSVAILSNCAKAAGSGARVLLVEIVAPETVAGRLAGDVAYAATW
ncbi:MAG: methyltransferase [Caulobacteraceae bacterium]